MARIIDDSYREEVGRQVSEFLSVEGYGPSEAIGGLVEALLEQVLLTANPDQALDEVFQLLDNDGEGIDDVYNS